MIDAGLMDGGLPSAVWPAIGTKYQGRVVNVERMQCRDYDTGLPETWEDGSPKMQHVVTLEQQNPNENGERRVKVYVRYKILESIKAAILESGHDRNESIKDGFMVVEYIGQEKPKNKKLDGIKLFRATFIDRGDPKIPEWARATDNDNGDWPF